MSEILFFDSTLRDGSHAVKHNLVADDISQYCQNADSIGFHTIIVGHGNGLGASSLQVGESAISDEQMLTSARKNLQKTRLGVFLIPGFGTIRDDLSPAIELGVDLVCVASHCTEADVTKQHIEYSRQMGRDAYGILMMQHRASKEQLLQEALKMQDYGAQGVILMDSAGSSVVDETAERISYLVERLNIAVGFHAHNNLGLAIANSYVAIKAGASIIDGTVRGFGAGSGNCQLEVLAGLLWKLKINSHLDFFGLLNLSENIVAKMMLKPQGITATGLVSGLAGIFSGFAPHVEEAAKRYGVCPWELFIELGRRKMVAGQEDFIVDVAMYLAQRKKTGEDGYQIEALL
ncbi:MAG: 4-hydroxy-2-oxovalerate aldolase [Phycisphaerae bacterium]|nr:4-hydroxy-2-oxovalerate aldolase [Phycisphaerae bacterium]